MHEGAERISRRADCHPGSFLAARIVVLDVAEVGHADRPVAHGQASGRRDARSGFEPGAVEPALVVLSVLHVRHPDLFQVVRAGRGLGLVARLVERREQHRRQDGNDGDHHEQFDQREILLSHETLLFVLGNAGVNL